MGVARSGESVFSLFIATVLALIGIWFLVQARRRRFGVNRYCATCDYPLRGLPEGVTRCPECGADLTVSSSIAVGRNRSDDTLKIAAIALIAPLVLIIGVTVADALRSTPAPVVRPAIGIRTLPAAPSVRWTPTPPRVVARPFQDLSDDALADTLLSEPRPADFRTLVREATYRVQSNRERSSEPRAWMARLIDRALDAQAEPSQIPFDDWSDLVQGVEHTTEMTNAQWSRYVRQGVRVSVILPKSIRIGSPAPIRYSTKARLTPTDVHRLTCRLITFSIGEASTDDVLRDPPSPAGDFNALSPFLAVFPAEEWSKVRPGPAVAKLTILVAGSSGMRAANSDCLIRLETPVTLIAAATTSSNSPVRPGDETSR